MISIRLLATLSTALLVTGALLLGQALHGSVVTGQHPVASAWAVVRGGVGLVFIALGYRFQTPASEYASVPSEAPEPEDGDSDEAPAGGGDFDSDLSPLSDEQFENLEADDRRSATGRTKSGDEE